MVFYKNSDLGFFFCTIDNYMGFHYSSHSRVKRKRGMKMKVLVTGFEPFGGEAVNPAYLAVSMLPEWIAGAQIIKKEIPTAFYQSREKLCDLIKEIQPDMVLCIGQAGGRAGITIEKVGINLAEAGIPDNNGNQPVDEPIDHKGETAYFSNLPLKAMVQEIRNCGIPASISYTAGTYVCNYLLYCLLFEIAMNYPQMRGGFIHVPYATQQGIGKASNTPTMEVSTIATAIEGAIRAAVETAEDISLNAGITH